MRAHTLEKPFKCETCGFRFTINCNLLRHKRVHAGLEKKFVCHIADCKKEYRWNDDLRHHIREVHETSTPKFACKIGTCKFSTGSLVHLKSHAKGVHSTEYAFNCQFCGKGFAIKQDLVSHMKGSHLERMKYKCESEGCKKTFATKVRFERHSLKHRLIKIEPEVKLKKVFPCYFCSRNLASQSAHWRHIL